MGDVLVVSQPSNCQTDGYTNAPLPAGLFNALMMANTEDVQLPDLNTLSPHLNVDDSGKSPRLLSARLNKTVVAISKVGILDNAAIACLEVFGSTESGFFLVFSRDGTGKWNLDSELPAWENEPRWPAEELPDGTPYEGQITP